MFIRIQLKIGYHCISRTIQNIGTSALCTIIESFDVYINAAVPQCAHKKALNLHVDRIKQQVPK